MTKNHVYFMKADLSAYLGKWIAIDCGKIVAFGNSPKKVFQKAIQHRQDNTLLLARVPRSETEIL